MRHLFLAAMLAFAALPARAEGITALIAAVKPSVVAIGTHEVTRRPPDTILGAGFAVGDGSHILTALHVVRGAPAASLSIYVGQGDDAQIVRATQVAADQDNDMALLRIEGKALRPLRLSTGNALEEGEEVAFTGYPVGAVYGLYPATHRGIVSAVTPIARAQVKPGDLTPDMIRAIDRKIMAYQLDATSFPGNSGGPMVSPASGAVVGVINSTYVQETKDSAANRPSGITFAMPIQPAVEMLRRAGLQP